MNSRSNRQVGAMHPVIFFVLVYGISIFLAFFICNTVYNSLHAANAAPVSKTGVSDYALAQTAALAQHY